MFLRTDDLFAEQVGGMTNMTVMKEDTVGHLRPTMRKTIVPAAEDMNAHAHDPIHHVSS